MSDPQWRQRMESVFDGYLARVEAVTHLERRRMKALLATVGLTSVALIIDAVLLLQAQQAVRPVVQEWWPQIVAAGTGLVAFASLRVAVKAHQQYVDAQLKLKAEKGEVTLQVEQIKGDIQALQKGLDEFRRRFEDYALDEARRRAEHATKRREA